ncbi:LysR family transcriptional regulator [Aquabacter sp. CN5-332]|uniref:LysR family transcriptional regulator n=1 Tax=Aquabacter sp. CN5-332 TaxID=3156608 RepID=UPI0032B4B855
MDSRKLGYFATVARAGSFSRAAEELRIAQPALSRRVREIEEELGQALLVRHGRGVRLTPVGAAVLRRVEEIESLLAQIKAEAKRGDLALRGTVTLGLPPAAGLLIGPPLAAFFAETHADVVLKLREGISSLIHEWLSEKRIDVGLVYNVVPMDGLHVIPLLREPMVLVGPPGDVLRMSDTEELRLRHIAKLPLIMPSLPHNNRRMIERAAARHEVRLNIRTEVDSVALTKAMVRAGHGYTILTYSSVHEEVARGDLTMHTIDHPPIIATLSAVMLKETATTPLARELTDALRATLLGLIQRGIWRDSATSVPDPSVAEDP